MIRSAHARAGKYRLRHWWVWVVALLLMTWALRLVALDGVPPGWRDDELINIHALSGDLLAGRFPVYFTGASGHEPLYHYLHAAFHAVLGFNVLSGHLLSVTLGTLTVALTIALARRLFGDTLALVTAFALTCSFWSLLYSRVATRHIALPPFALAIFLLLPLPGTTSGDVPGRGWWRRWAGIGLLLGVSLYTYPAARLLPLILGAFFVYLFLFHRRHAQLHWRGCVLALALTGLLAIPLTIAVMQGRSAAAAEGIGADARLAELAVPLRELRAGNVEPLLRHVVGTLGMFHATGDPEWLYNIPGRPVFGLLGGLIFWCGVTIAMVRWRYPRHVLMLLWLAAGLLPAFVSVPPASLSHTILAQPVVYLFPLVTFFEMRFWFHRMRGRWRSWVAGGSILLCAVFLLVNAARDLRDYFWIWPRRGMVRFLYRANYRDAAHLLDAHPAWSGVAMYSDLMGPWNRLALDVDMRRSDAKVRLFDPQRALVYPQETGAETARLIMPFDAAAHPWVEGLLLTHWEAVDWGQQPDEALPFQIYHHISLEPSWEWDSLTCYPLDRSFANGLLLSAWCVSPLDGDVLQLLFAWSVTEALDLPHPAIVANPPPPGVYRGPRLSVFVHLLDESGSLLDSDDGMWVDPYTLHRGDRFVQCHALDVPAGAMERTPSLAVGLYDPLDGQRWHLLDARGEAMRDQVSLPLPPSLLRGEMP